MSKHKHTHTSLTINPKYNLYYLNWDNLPLPRKAGPGHIHYIKGQMNKSLSPTKSGAMRNTKADYKATTYNERFYLYTHRKERAVEIRAARGRKGSGKEESLNMCLSVLSFPMHSSASYKVAKKARQEMGERKLKKKSTHPSPISSPLSQKELCLSVET